jgi:hypothetical protein
MNKKIILISFVVFISLIANASRLKKGFQALEIYNYFYAKKMFEKSKKRHVVAASYGLSVIYQRKDNPFYNLDSAYNNIVLSLEKFSNLKDKLKYKKYGVDSLRIVRQRDLITLDLFKRALDVNSIYGFQDFIDKNKWSPNKEESIILRDSLFFHQMNERGTSNDYALFLKTYPNSFYTKRATNLYDKTYYVEKTKNDHLISYIEFLSLAPNSPFFPDAEDRIFEISIMTKSVQSYENFIRDYPLNRNISVAWKSLYETSLQNNYSKQEIERFLQSHPDFPFINGAKKELKLEDVEFLSIRIDNEWGFISEDMEYFIVPQYIYVEPFYEGLALVAKDGKVGYISKSGELKIPTKFDDALSFENGYAVVQVDEKFGLINRSGEYVVLPKYEYIGNVIEGLCYFENLENWYGYFDRKGIERLKAEYTDAGSFDKGRAVAAKNGSYGVIDKFGTTSIPFMFEEIKKIDSSSFSVKFNNKWGVLTLEKDTLLPLVYDYIGPLNNNYAMVEKDFKFNFWNIKTGEIVSKDWFETYTGYREQALFYDGYAKVKTDEGYNFVDTLGIRLFKKSYQDLGYYANNIAFEKNDQWGFISNINKEIVKPIYDKTYSFNRVGGIVALEPLLGVVNPEGNLLLDVFYEEFTFVTDTILIVKSRGYYGLISTSKDTILDIKYKFIEPYSDSVVKIVSDGAQWYYNVLDNKWIRKEDN